MVSIQVAPDSAQLGLYVLGAVLEVDPTLAGSSIAPNGHAGTSIIVQPNVNDGKVKVHDWTYAALRALRDRVIDTLQRIKAAGFHLPVRSALPLVPGSERLPASGSDCTRLRSDQGCADLGDDCVRRANQRHARRLVPTLKVLDKWSRSFMQPSTTIWCTAAIARLPSWYRKTDPATLDRRGIGSRRELSALGINPYDKVLDLASRG